MNSFLKISIGLGVVLLVVGAALYILGSERGLHSTSLTIDAPPATVFNYLTDTEQATKWVSGVDNIEPLGDVVNDVGARYLVTRKSKGGIVETEDEIIRYVKDELYSVQSIDEFHVETSIFQLEPKDNQTKLTYRMRVANRGVGKFIAVFDQSSIQEKMEIDARRLKELIEGHPLPSTIDEAEFSGTVSTETNDPDDK